jgi:ligand-binding SRPBCC domain-containing protein
MRHRLERTQIVPGDLTEVFAFFKSPRNLEAITPPWLGFRVVHSSDSEVCEGTRIAYRLRLHGIPITWESRITEYAENAMFADEQLKGPYRYWYHRHLFRAVPGGVAIDDIVEYELPFGPLGRLVHRLFVRRQLAQIFDHRALVIGERFPSLSSVNGMVTA